MQSVAHLSSIEHQIGLEVVVQYTRASLCCFLVFLENFDLACCGALLQSTVMLNIESTENRLSKE